jgi:S1-C subfamily serine protease
MAELTFVSDEQEALDAYSRTVSAVAELLAPSVASVRRGSRGAGSAVVISADGFLLTSAHVVERARSVRVALVDGRDLPARITGADPLSDLAVLRAEAGATPTIAASPTSSASCPPAARPSARCGPPTT